MSESIIEIRGLTRLIPGTDRPLLDRLDLIITGGDRLGMAGESGCGKTTLMRAIAALDPVHSGTLRFQGNVVCDFPNYRRRVIYLHQRPAMMGGTVRENLQLPYSFAAARSCYNEQRLIDHFNRLKKPASILDQTVATLSGGEQQIVALLRAIQLDPDVLLFDEPTASLDRQSVEGFERLVDSWFADDSRRSLVWISHDAEQLHRMTDRIVSVSEGRIQ